MGGIRHSSERSFHVAHSHYKGGCLCGAVRVVARAEPYRVGLCHCLDCRKHSGSAFQAFAIFPAEHVTVTGATAEYEGRHFCPRCGSSLSAAPAMKSKYASAPSIRRACSDPVTSYGCAVARSGCRRFRWRGAIRVIAKARADPSLEIEARKRGI